ncbi:hypothetical protein H2202_008442 [Exophiala xenobiotica]|nr:hypothetical protein H2202_008442 [Exophiala xenobiotica]
MKLLWLLTILFTGSALSARVTNPKKVPRNAVLLSKVSAITVRAGKQTASRRVPPVPQLQCVGPAKICSLYTVDVMRCTNEGVDYDENNVQWSCKASLPDEFKLGSTDVTCEGYESSDDPYVLKGSCGVEYRLLLTDKGEEKYGSHTSTNFNILPKTHLVSEKIVGYAFMAVFFLVLFIIVRGFYRAWREDPARRLPRPRGGGFGGSGGGDDDDPPPPYDPRPPPRPKKPTWSSGSNSGSNSTRRTGATQEEGWRPGFWTGTAAGAAAGYFAGRGARTQPEPPRRAPWGTQWGNGWLGGRQDNGLFGGGNNQGGWFGGGGGGGGARPGPSSSRTPSSSSSFSSTRHESSGFGGTSRR